MGGLLGGLDVGTRSHLAPDHPVLSSLVVLQQGRTRGIATRVYLGSGLARISSDRRMSDGDAPDSPLAAQVERRGVRRYAAAAVGDGTSRVRDTKDRTWHDVPWATHPVTLVYRNAASGVAAVGFAPSGLSLPIRRRGSPAACSS